MIIEDVLFDKNYLTIYYEPENKLLHLKWKDYTTSESFRDALKFILETIKEYQVEYCLGNLKLMQAILPQDEEWAAQEWFPGLANTSLRKLALVTSLDYFNNTSIKRIVNTEVPFINFETRYFVDAEHAKQWLSSSV